MVCETPDLGRIKKAMLFLLDDCMSPVYGEGAGYIDDCPAGVETSDNVDDGEDFTRRCADGSIKRYLPGVKSLQDIEVSVDFHWIDPEWIALANGASPIVYNGEVVGWSDGTRDRFNVLVAIQQEILGGDVCGGEDADCNNYWRLYPLKGAKITEDGDIGSEDNVIRIMGNTVDSSQLGSGPIPMFCDPVTGEADWATECFPAGQHRYRFIGGPSPDVCGIYDTEAPPVPCTEPSA